MKNTIFYCNTLSKSKGFGKVYKLFTWLYLLPIFVSAQVSFKMDILGKEGLFREELSYSCLYILIRLPTIPIGA